MTALALAFLTPLAGAVLIVLARQYPVRRDTITLASSTLLFAAVATMAPAVFDGARGAVVRIP